jgi:hypothetical protein
VEDWAVRAHLRWSAIAFAIVMSLTLGAVPAAAAGPAPGESCVPGTVWTDLESGVKWICIYDELYGGTRWELLSMPGQVGSQSWLARSSSSGCTLGTVGFTGSGGSGADAFARSYRWPCATTQDRWTRRAGEIRARAIVQRYNGSWSTCRDTGYAYSTVTSWSWRVGLSMGSTADCGTGYYRAWGFASVYQGGVWRGGSLITPSLYLR